MTGSPDSGHSVAADSAPDTARPPADADSDKGPTPDLPEPTDALVDPEDTAFDAVLDGDAASDVRDAASDASEPADMASAHVAFANEPANHVVLAEHDFSFVPSDPAAGSPLEGFWNLYPGYPQMGLQEANHADARTSAPDTVEVELAGGLEPYSQGWWIEAWEPTYGAYSQAYMSMSVKLLGDDFENDQGGILLGFFSVAIQEDTELRLQVLVAPSQSPRDAAFPAKVALNEYPANMTLRTFLPNVDDRDLLTVGEFHEIELLLTNNTIGEADGTLKLWIDGVHVADYDDLQMQTAANPGNIGYFVELIDWLGSTARDEDDVIAVDHIRISALP